MSNTINSIAQVNALRSKILEGYKPSPEELHDAFAFLRTERIGAATAAAEKSTRKAVEKVDKAAIGQQALDNLFDL
jgi:hypothetical protein